MDAKSLEWLRRLDGNAGLASAEAADVAGANGLPQDYAEFLREHDGAEGFIGASYVRFYGRSGFVADNASPALDHLVGLVVFGTNGAGEAFAFDRSGQVVVIPWIGSREDAIPQGSFADFIQRLHDDRVFEPE